MGCGCNFNTAKATEEKNELINEVTQIEETIKNNPDLLNSITKIQSCFRGMKIRSKVKDLEISPNNNDANITAVSQENDQRAFHPFTTDQITEEELNILFNEFSPLEDGVTVEINGPIQYENNNSN